MLAEDSRRAGYSKLKRSKFPSRLCPHPPCTNRPVCRVSVNWKLYFTCASDYPGSERVPARVGSLTVLAVNAAWGTGWGRELRAGPGAGGRRSAPVRAPGARRTGSQGAGTAESGCGARAWACPAGPLRPRQLRSLGRHGAYRLVCKTTAPWYQQDNIAERWCSRGRHALARGGLPSPSCAHTRTHACTVRNSKVTCFSSPGKTTFCLGGQTHIQCTYS